MGKAAYAYSIKTTRVKEKDFPYNGQRITCTNDLINFARALQDSDIEKFLVVYLDAQNSVIGIQVMNDFNGSYQEILYTWYNSNGIEL